VKLWLKILALCHGAFGAVGLGVFGLLLASYAALPDPAYTDEIVAISSVLGFLGAAYLVPSLTGGIGLLRARPFARVIILMLIALFILGVILLAGYLLRDVTDLRGRQQLTPMPEMPPAYQRPEFKMPELPVAPER